jgi:DNA-directed RNA polymerase specialized sigma subunit
MKKFVKTDAKNRETYTYRDVNGKVVTILRAGEDGVTAEDIKQLHLLDDKEIYNNLKNSKAMTQSGEQWHLSLEALAMGGELEKSEYLAPFSTHIEITREIPFEIEKLREAFKILTPKQQALIHAIYFEGRTASDIARTERVDRSAIHYRLKIIYSKIKKFFD